MTPGLLAFILAAVVDAGLLVGLAFAGFFRKELIS